MLKALLPWLVALVALTGCEPDMQPPQRSEKAVQAPPERIARLLEPSTPSSLAKPMAQAVPPAQATLAEMAKTVHQTAVAVASPVHAPTKPPANTHAASMVAPPDSKPAMPVKSVRAVRLETPRLDLSLPKDWLDQVEPVESRPGLSLLPPMFESRPSLPPVQLGGRLIANDQDDEIRGAEISIEFKH